MATGSVFRRCSCRDHITGKVFGKSCSKFKQARHGTWAYRLELPPNADGARRPRRRGGFGSKQAAQEELNHACALLKIPDRDDRESQARVGDVVEQAIRLGEKLPSYDEMRRHLRRGASLLERPTVAEWLQVWLKGKKRIKKTTWACYESHIRIHLIPHLGYLRLDRLRTIDISEMFDMINETNELIKEGNITRRGVANQLTATRDRKTRREIRAQLDQMPPFRRISGVTTQHRIRATLRAALNDAIAQDLIATNPAQHVELTPAANYKAIVWTEEYVARWKKTGTTPSPVMVWTPQQTGQFLDHITNDRLYALYHLLAFRGLRRGEACGVHWTDLDLDSGTLMVRWQVVQSGWKDYQLDTPKTEDSADLVALDIATIEVLKAHHQHQQHERITAGESWQDIGLAFTNPDGSLLNPAKITDHFHNLYEEIRLPPIRLHDLRHGAATLAFATGADLKIVSSMLRHSSITITAKTYVSVLPQVAREVAEALARVVPRTATPHHPMPRNTAEHSPETLGLPSGAQDTQPNRKTIKTNQHNQKRPAQHHDH